MGGVDVRDWTPQEQALPEQVAHCGEDLAVDALVCGIVC
jgi:hypothetical protein